MDTTIGTIASLEGISLVDAFDKFITYLAVDLMIGSEATSILKLETMSFLEGSVCVEKLRKINEDFLGKYYISNILQKRDLLPTVNYDKIESTIKKNGFPKAVYLNDIMTSHKAIELCKKVGKENVTMYAASNDLKMYRICLINVHLFELPLSCLYIDPNSKYAKKVDLKTSSINWSYANRWNPTKTNLLETLS